MEIQSNKIIVNGRFLLHRITGVERYAGELLQELDKMCIADQLILAVPPEVSDIPEYKHIKVIHVGNLHNLLWEHVSFPNYVRRQNGISLNLCNVAPFLNPGIVAIHDMKIQAHPEYFGVIFLFWYRIVFRREMRTAKKIITVSEFSKSEIIKYYHVLPDRIVVIPDAWQHMERIRFDEKALSKFGLLKKQYYFSMSSMDPNKNFRWIASAAENNPNQTFVVAGAVNKAVFSKKNNYVLADNMKLLGYISDSEAKTLMRDCKAFIFPSFYEGFGMPPLEAMGCGCEHVIVSDIPVMHEIFGDTVEFVNPERAVFKHSESFSIPCNESLPTDKYSWKKSAELLSKLIYDYCHEDVQ